MRTKLDGWLLVLSGLIVFFATAALLVNSFIYNYPGNNYFPPNTVQIGLPLVLFYIGLIQLFGKDKHITQIGLELIYFFLIMSLIALATNAVQLTPFTPIDQHIVAFEHYFHIDISVMLEWTNRHPTIHLILGFIYDSISNQMSAIPLLIIAMGRFQLIREYYFLLLTTTLLGFGFYYFFPTTAPASVIASPLFTPYQLATGLKFKEIHNHISPSTIEGGLIALPSFHCIWGLYCVYLLKEWPIFCFILLLANIILCASCVLLGWHYPIDVMAGVLLALLCYWLLLLCKKRM